MGEDELVGQSAAMRDVRRLIDIAAPTKTTILIQGATGTGKELVARSIHKNSPRKGEMISINCSAIPAELLESELFGYEKGAFTGAEKMRQGRFEMASGGTLFLDEIGDMPLSLQAKLLRAIESRTIQRVGGGKDIPIDLRLVCATHQNIEADIEAGKFRADLFYRINVFPIKIPELAERAVDIPQIVKALKKAIEKQNEIGSPPDFDESAMQEFMRYTWPGNVRELENLVRRLTLLNDEPIISASAVESELLPDKTEKSVPADSLSLSVETHIRRYFNALNGDMPPPGLYARVLREIEEPLIVATLAITRGNQLRAADILGLNRNTLRKKISGLDIQVTRRRKLM